MQPGPKKAQLIAQIYYLYYLPSCQAQYDPKGIIRCAGCFHTSRGGSMLFYLPLVLESRSMSYHSSSVEGPLKCKVEAQMWAWWRERKCRHRRYILRKVNPKEVKTVNSSMKTSQIKCSLFHGLLKGRKISLTECLLCCRPIFKNLAYISSFHLLKNTLACVLLCSFYISEN